MAAYSYSTEGIFPVITRALSSDGLGSFSYSYTPSVLEPYNELDFGNLLTPVSTLDYGSISDANATEVDHGRIIYVTIVEPFGFVKVVNGASWSATNTFEGRGIAFTFGRQTSPAVYGYIVDGKVKDLGGEGLGVFSAKHDGAGSTSILGQSFIGLVVGIQGAGNLFTISSAEDKFQPNWVSDGSIGNIVGEAEECILAHHEGFGDLFTLSDGRQRSTNSFVGSGGLKLRSDKKERIAESYVPSDCNYFYDYDYGFIDYTGCTNSETVTGSLSGSSTACEIKVELGTTASISQQYQVALGLNEPSTIVDLGQITINASPQHDYGHIHVSSNECPFELFRIDINVGAADKFLPTWTSRGSIGKITGAARLPLFASVTSTGTIGKISGVSITNFSLLQPGDGLFDFVGSSDVVITQGYIGSGFIPALSGAAESVSFNPDEAQLLFSPNGEARIASTSNWIGSGVLFTFESGTEKVVYEWVGSGRLFGFSSKEEARVYSYNCESIVEFETPDYGYIERCLSSEIISGDISGDTSACTSKVEEGTTARVVLGSSYKIELNSDIATDFIDYGYIRDAANALIDYGHILDSARQGLPGCVYGLFDITGSAAFKLQPTYIAEGFIGKLTGEAIVPLDVSVPVFGTIGTLRGESVTNFSLLHPGDGQIKVQGTLINFNFTLGFLGSGTIPKLGGASEVVAFNPPEDVPTIKLRGTSGDPGILLAHTTEGTLFTINGGDIRVQHSYFGSGRLFGFNSKEEARTYVYDGGICVDEPDYDYGFLQGECLTIETIQGTVTGTTASCIAKVAPGTTASVDGTYRIETNDGTATEFYDYDLTSEPPDGVYDYGHILAETGVLCPAYLFKIRRGALTDYQTFDWQVSWVSSGTIRVSGVSQNQKVPRYNGDGQIFAINGAAESLTVNPVERDFLFSFTGTLAESFTPAPEIGSGNLFTFNNLVERISNDYVGTGTFVLSGESTNRYTPNHNGSGSFRKLSGAAESLTVNPVERQMLFSFTGELKEAFIANPPEEGTEIKISGEIPTPLLTFAEQPEVQISVFGTAIQRYTPNVIGSGSFRKLSGAAESLTVNPEEKQLLFSFTGGITSEKHTEVYVGVDTPIRIRRGALSDFETFDWQPSWVSQGTVKVSGDVRDKWVPNNVGFGNIFAISGSAESFTVNPDERQMLFSFIGTRSNESTTTISQIEGGSLFNIGGAVESYAAAPKGDGLYRISGEGFITASLLHVGSGTFRKFSGAAESFTVNPDEKQLLFSFTGTLVESFGVAETKQIEVDIDGIGSFARSFTHSGIGSIRITGDSTNRFVINNIGFGNIFNIGGSAEAVTFNPDEKQMLFSFTGERISEKTTAREVSQDGKITLSGTSGDPLLTFAEQPEVQIAVSGESHTTRSRDHVGSGSLFAFSGSAEAFRAVPPTDKALFKFTGNSVNKFTADYVGSGSFRKLSGAAEAVTFNPDEKQMLFSFVGAGTEKTTAREVSQGGLFKASGEAGVLVRFAHTGEGTISVTGDTKFTRARDFVGSGFIPVLSGAAESLTFNPDEKQMLFSFVGTRDSEKITARELGTPGEFTLQGTSGDPLLTFAEKSFGNVVVSGISTVVRTQAFAGSGRLFGFANGDEAYGRAPYVTSGTINVSGNALIRVEVFQPPRTYVWII